MQIEKINLKPHDLPANLSDFKDLLRRRRLHELRPALDAYLGRRDVMEASEAYLKALDSPRFADPCTSERFTSPREDKLCNLLFLSRLDNMIQLKAIQAWDSGNQAEALDILRKLIRANQDAASTARTLISNLVTLEQLRGALLITDVFVTPGTLPSGEQRQALFQVTSQIERRALRLERSCITGYAMTYARIQDLDHQRVGGFDSYEPFGHHSRLLLDPEKTEKSLRLATSSCLYSARYPNPTEPLNPREISWSYNPIGQMILRDYDSGLPGIRKYELAKIDVLELRDRLLEKLAP